MQRRQFSIRLMTALAAASGLGAVNLAQAKNTTPSSKDYKTLTKPTINDAPKGKVQVLEFFAYSCIFCYKQMPEFEKWHKSAPKNAHIQRVPVSFNPVTEPHARLFYTIEALDRMDLHEKLFRAVLEERKQLITEKEIRQFFTANEVDEEKGWGIYSSFGVQAKVQKANQLTKAYDLQATPAIGIGGRYLLSGFSMEHFNTLDYLLKQFK